MSNFRVGQKVVCIKRGKWVTIADGEKVDFVKPIYGEVYVVSQIDVEPRYTFLSLEGFGEEYDASRFRPLVEMKDDIAMFKALLAPTPDLVVMPDLVTTGSGL